MRDVVILIPPSESKNAGGSGTSNFSDDVKHMIKKLQAYDGDQSKLLGVKGKALEAAKSVNKSILLPGVLPAIERYSGVVYNGIKYATLDKKAKQFFDRHVRIISAVFGLVKPQDQIPNYKLKIDKLDAAKYWRPIITEQLKPYFVIDLLPNAHRKAIAFEDGVSVDFIVEKNGKRMPAGHNGKLIKGKFVRWLCENHVMESEYFFDFEEDGFKWNGEVFLKKVKS